MAKQRKLFTKKQMTKNSKTEMAYKTVKTSLQREEGRASWDHIENLIEVGEDDSGVPRKVCLC